MMNGDFVKEFAERLAAPHTYPVNGREVLCLPEGWKDATPAMKVARPLALSTLDSVADLVKLLGEDKVILHVAGAAEVCVLGRLEGEQADFRQQVYATAKPTISAFAYGQFHAAEGFFISLQSLFVATADRDRLLELITATRSSAVTDTVDDGVAQKVTTGRGVAFVGEQRLPNPVVLRPYRTFTEVLQPESSFVLRARGGADGDQRPQFALFGADGGAWAVEAIRSIREYLAGKCTCPILA